MESLSSLIKVHLPNYLKNLPVPDSFSGIANLSGSDWMRLLPLVGTVSLFVFVTIRAFRPLPIPPKLRVNLALQKENPKVVNLVEIEDLDREKISYCRCWRSKKFPYCDGTHSQHNEETGDNVGPLVIKNSKLAKA